jgi:prepilin-type N-terminal cleavage/methylation domain-containing protein
MIKREAGFTLVELLITMVVFVFFIAAASQVFTGLLTQFKQQSKIAETNIEGIVGLEILRQDLEHAGYGLPWVIPAAVSYSEASAGYNDSPSNPPRAILSGNGAGFNGSSDELIIKATNVARNNACQKSTLVNSNNQVREWRLPDGNFDNQNRLETNDRVLVISPGTSTNERLLVVKNNGTFYTTYQRGTNPDSLGDADFAPSAATEVNIVYGISPERSSGDPPETITPRMPFNRADYYISTSSPPSRCAPNTGVFSKNVISHANGSRADNLPLLDCVADMQVAFGVDTDATPDGQINCYTNDLANVFATVTAQNIRERVKEVRVYILSHEGQYDRDFTFDLNSRNAGLNPAIGCPTCIRVGEGLPLAVCEGGIAGRDFNLSTITNWQNYRWKLYTMVVKPNNLR